MGLTLRGHTASVNDVAYSPDDRRIVSGSDDQTLKVWDALADLSGHQAAQLRWATSSPQTSRRGPQPSRPGRRACERSTFM
jgi:WD40 repeat protein